MSFDGASVVISHDRALLDRAATAVLSFEGDGRVVRYASREQALSARSDLESPAPAKSKTKRQKPAAQGLTWAEKRELEALPGKLEDLERERDALGERMADPSLYKESSAEAAVLGQKLRELESSIEATYARWELLESRT